ncbi:MAG: GtrA family protein [Rhodocyclaceae bacterium]|nr:GtrA family protein [Rhodocyclaceae bacterium]
MKAPRIWSEIFRYLMAGGVITIAAHLIFLLGLRLGMQPQIAWAVSFACGVVAGYVIHGRYVFRATPRKHHWISFPLTYLLRFAIGELILTFCMSLGLSAGWAGLWTNLALAPIGFLLLRFVLHLNFDRKADPDALAGSGSAPTDAAGDGAANDAEHAVEPPERRSHSPAS